MIEERLDGQDLSDSSPEAQRRMEEVAETAPKAKVAAEAEAEDERSEPVPEEEHEDVPESSSVLDALADVAPADRGIPEEPASADSGDRSGDGDGDGDNDESGEGGGSDEGEEDENESSELLSMTEDELRGAVEAVLFAAAEPLPPRQLADLFGVPTAAVKNAVRQIRDELNETGRSFQLEEIAGGYQFLTRSSHGSWIKRLRRKQRESRLSAAAFETLAVIAYKQPITKADLEAIRGVGCGPILKTLMDRSLIKVIGRDESLGRPLLYGTTKRFLESFGLSSLRELPQPDALSKAFRAEGGEAPAEEKKVSAEVQAPSADEDEREESAPNADAEDHNPDPTPPEASVSESTGEELPADPTASDDDSVELRDTEDDEWDGPDGEDAEEGNDFEEDKDENDGEEGGLLASLAASAAALTNRHSEAEDAASEEAEAASEVSDDEDDADWLDPEWERESGEQSDEDADHEEFDEEAPDDNLDEEER